MKKLGFVLKGTTFLRAVGTLIYYANECGFIPVIAAYKERKGKSYDSFKKEKLFQHLSGKKVVFEFINSDKEVVNLFNKNDVSNVVCQDAHWHFSYLIDKFKVFSIGLFFDTIHYSFDGKPTKLKNSPYKTYFPTKQIKEKFDSLCQDKWNGEVFTSPTFDHSLFVNQENSITSDVVFLAPPIQSLKEHTMGEVLKLIEYCRNKKINLIVKDRKKTPWDFLKQYGCKIITEEEGFPYTSMNLLLNSKVHITAYGTSVFESNFLNKQAINLPAKKGSGNNYRIPEYGFDNLYNSDICKTLNSNLIGMVENAIHESKNMKTNLHKNDNFSINILNDIMGEI